MGSVLTLGRSEYSVVWLPAKPSVHALVPSPDDLENDPAPRKEAVPGMPDPRAVARFVMAFCIGVIVTLAWQSYSDAAKPLIVSSSLQPRESARIAHASSDVIAPAAFAARFPDLQDLAWQNADQLAAIRQVNLSFVQFAFAQEQTMRNIPRPQRTERHIVSKMSVPLPRPAPPAETRKHASRSATTMAGAGPNAHRAVTSSASVGSSSPLPVLLTHLDTGHKRTRSSAADLRGPAPEPFSQIVLSARQSLISALSRITGIQL
jgi:hypothetical protein